MLLFHLGAWAQAQPHSFALLLPSSAVPRGGVGVGGLIVSPVHALQDCGVACSRRSSSPQPSECESTCVFLNSHDPFDRCLDIFWCAVSVCVRVQIHVYIPFKEALSNVFRF